MRKQINSTIISIKTNILFFTVIIMFALFFMGCSDNPTSPKSGNPPETNKDTVIYYQKDSVTKAWHEYFNDTYNVFQYNADSSIHPDTMYVEFTYVISSTLHLNYDLGLWTWGHDMNLWYSHHDTVYTIEAVYVAIPKITTDPGQGFSLYLMLDICCWGETYLKVSGIKIYSLKSS